MKEPRKQCNLQKKSSESSTKQHPPPASLSRCSKDSKKKDKGAAAPEAEECAHCLAPEGQHGVTLTSPRTGRRGTSSIAYPRGAAGAAAGTSITNP